MTSFSALLDQALPEKNLGNINCTSLSNAFYKYLFLGNTHFFVILIIFSVPRIFLCCMFCIFCFESKICPDQTVKSNPGSLSGSPRALAQKLPGDQVEEEESDVDDDDEDSCQIKVCQKMIEDLQLKVFNIERNLYAQIDSLKDKMELTSQGTKRADSLCNI